jgi:hypothetical protein
LTKYSTQAGAWQALSWDRRSLLNSSTACSASIDTTVCPGVALLCSVQCGSSRSGQCGLSVRTRGGGGDAAVAGSAGGEAAQRIAELAELLDGLRGTGAPVVVEPGAEGLGLRGESVLDRADPGEGLVRGGERVVDAVAVGPNGVHQLNGQHLAEQGRPGVGLAVVHRLTLPS